MAEQAFDLDINIDDKFWTNFSSHPSRNSSFFSQPSTSTLPQSPILENSQEPAPKKTAEEIIQSSQPLDEKMTALFQGDFKIDKQTKPSYHLLMDFEDKEGVPLILAKPSFTQKDVEQHFINLEKPKTLPLPPVVIKTPQEFTPQETYSEPNIREQETSRYNEEVPPQGYEQQTNYSEQDNTRQESEYAREEGDVLKIRELNNLSDNELEARSLHVSRRLDEEPVLQKEQRTFIDEDFGQPIVQEGRGNQIPSFTVPERRIEDTPAVPRKKVRFDGQILGNSLLRKVSFDSFHYVKFNTWRDDQNFLFDRFVKRTQFTKYIGQVSTNYGPNHLIKSYFNEGILKSSYLVERYFRNPFIYNK